MVSEYCLGTMTWGTQNSEREGHDQIAMALDHGVNFWDTAEMYPTNPVTKETIELPDERAGLLMVFQAYEKMSYGLILQATRPLSIGDKVKNP